MFIRVMGVYSIITLSVFITVFLVWFIVRFIKRKIFQKRFKKGLIDFSKTIEDAFNKLQLGVYYEEEENNTVK